MFELGYFIGLLGRNKVAALRKENVNLHSDINGVIYIPMDSNDAWHLKLAKEIKNAGLSVDLNKLLMK